MFTYGPPHMAEQKQDNQLEPTYSSSVRIRGVALRTYQKRWTIGRSGERGSGISVLAARHDDDDDDLDWWPLNKCNLRLVNINDYFIYIPNLHFIASFNSANCMSVCMSICPSQQLRFHLFYFLSRGQSNFQELF